MQLKRWNQTSAPSLDLLRTALGNQGYRVSEWTDPPGTVYPVHVHEYAEARWVVRGRLRVGLPERGEEITLEAGDRLDLEPNETYWADVDGEYPVMYLIGIKNGSPASANHRHNGSGSTTSKQATHRHTPGAHHAT